MNTAAPAPFSSVYVEAARVGLAMFHTNLRSISVLREDELRFRVMWPCICHAMQQAKAALTLLDSGLVLPAESNTRSAFEHAVTAQWVLLTEGGEQAVHAEASRQLKAHTADVATFIELPLELTSSEANARSSRGPSFQALCDRFSPPSELVGGPQRHLYSLYRDLCGGVHVSVRSWREYFTWDAETVISGLQPAGRAEPDAAFDLGLALAVFLSLGALEELRLGQPRLLEVQSIAERFGVPWSLRGDDQEPQRQPQGALHTPH